MQNLWNQETEKSFFENALQGSASPDQLFYITDDEEYVAYWPKSYEGKKGTLQSRNTLIGDFTENWVKQLIQTCVQDHNLFAVQGAVCQDIALTKRSPADVVLAKKPSKDLIPEDIVVIFEVKMSLVWNWKLRNDELFCIGDYQTHQGNPGLLRSDSMLKAIGKATNIRISSHQASDIPIIVIGNTPITESYQDKVDHLKNSGIIQGFWSINPQPLDGQNTIKTTNKEGFKRFENYASFQNAIVELLSLQMNFFSGMKSKKELGRLIQSANKASTYEEKAETLLSLLKDGKYE